MYFMFFFLGRIFFNCQWKTRKYLIINFPGSMSEGIYRRSGTNSKVTSLLSLLRKDAWEVQLSRKEYTEYDVSSVLKRFFRDLPEPLLTNTLHKYFCNASG